MDNITHTLIGITAGQLAAQSLSAPKNEKHEIARRRLLIWSSVIGNNFPDLDILYAGITPGPLGYLLHHRGHTHTLIGIIPQWFIVAFLFWLVRRRFGFSELTRGDWTRGGAIGALGFFLHILADSFNSYGVHPFFPFWNGWIYGDAIFIIEPVLWAIFATSIYRSSRNRLKIIPIVFLVGLLGFGWYQAFLSLSTVLIVVGLSTFLLYFFKNKNDRASLVAIALASLFIVMNFTLGYSLRKAFFQTSSKTERILDVALSPVPANPVCWFAIRIAVTENTYSVKRGITSLAPDFIDPTKCPNLGRLDTAVVEESENVGFAKVFWSEAHTTELSSFQILEKNCHLRSWMRFARVPFVQAGQVTDLRFSRRRMSNFSDLESQNGECPQHVPPWIPPRADLVDLIGGTSWF